MSVTTPPPPTTNNGLGWIPDVPDIRDQYFTVQAPVLEALPPKIDLRDSTFLNFPILDQGNLGSCTANCISAAITFATLKQKKPIFQPSRLFIYYNERVRINTVNSDSGAVIRDGIKSVNKEGACKEIPTWPYNIPQFTQKPSQQAYTEAQNYQAIQYRRLNNADINQLKACLAQGYPFVFGFSVYTSFMGPNTAKTGVMTMPTRQDRLQGGHAVLGIGYDDAKKVFIVRNSWGDRWGDKGYFYMPYSYITNLDLATDFWTITLME